MNRALLYLWVSLLKRRALCACKGLRRPANLLGFLAVAFCFGALFYYRREKWYAELVRPASLWGAAMIMLAGSFFKGFLQRGLAFELPDIEFLFTSPFTQRQIIFYRLLPNYLYAFLQAFAFLLIFASHLHHPFITWVCVVLFQVVCFHIATAAAIYSGTIREELHHRIRWMLLGFYFVVSVLYLRIAWDIKLIPKVLAGPLVDAAFYPALTLSNVTNLPFLQNWAELLKSRDLGNWRTLWEPAAYLAAFIFAAGISFVMLMGSRRNIFESSMTSSARVVERKRRLQEGQPIAQTAGLQLQSKGLPGFRGFQGVGGIIWKNLVIASRSRRELVLALVFTLIFTTPLISVLWLYHHYMKGGAQMSLPDTNGFHLGIALMLAFLPFLLQRTFPFDFRREGPHVLSFRTFPLTPIAVVLAELAVPTIFCLAFQALGIALLMIVGGFTWWSMLLVFLAFPAIAIALNAVWNFHYLLSATKRSSGKTPGTTPVGLLLVVALSFLVFYPAGWVAAHVGKYFNDEVGIAVGASTALGVQYIVDGLLILMLAQLYQRFEVSQDA